MERLTFTDNEGDKVRLSDCDDLSVYEEFSYRAITVHNAEENQSWCAYLRASQLRELGEAMIREANIIEGK